MVVREHLGLVIEDTKLASVHEIDRPQNIDTLAEIGCAAAERLVEDRHFPAVFDVAR
jgi:hypothetical protein